jgi:hypothetical protein
MTPRTPPGGISNERSFISSRSPKPFVDVLELDHLRPEARSGRDAQLDRLHRLLGLLLDELLVAREARLAARAAGLGRLADPLELARDHLLALLVLPALRLELVLLLLQVFAVVALVRPAAAALDLEHPADDVVEEVPVVRDQDHGALVLLQMVLEPLDRVGVEVVRRLVEQEHVGVVQEQLAQRDAPALAARELLDVGVHRREAERRRGLLEVAVELPDLLVRHLLGEPLELVAHLARLGELVVARLDLEERLDGLAQVAEDVELLVQRGLLLEVADREVADGLRGALELLVDPRQDAQEGRFPRAVGPDDADLGALEEREGDALEDLALAEELVEVLELEDDLVGHRGRKRIARPHRTATPGRDRLEQGACAHPCGDAHERSEDSRRHSREPDDAAREPGSIRHAEKACGQGAPHLRAPAVLADVAPLRAAGIVTVDDLARRPCRQDSALEGERDAAAEDRIDPAAGVADQQRPFPRKARGGRVGEDARFRIGDPARQSIGGLRVFAERASEYGFGPACARSRILHEHGDVDPVTGQGRQVDPAVAAEVDLDRVERAARGEARADAEP